MVKQLQKVIEELGYSPNEAKTYLATLALGEAHVSDIAVKVKLPRSSVQAILDTLQRGGVVNFYVQRRYKYWVAENPERLLNNLKKREEAMREALPSLSALRKESWGKRRRSTDDEALGPLRLLADVSEQPLLIADEHVEIRYVNKAWEEQFGYSFEEVRGQNPRMLQSGKTPREVYTRMWEALRAGTMFQSDEVVDTRKDGTFFNLLTTIFPVKREGKVFYIQVLADITERKRVEALKRHFVKTASLAPRR